MIINKRLKFLSSLVFISVVIFFATHINPNRKFAYNVDAATNTLLEPTHSTVNETLKVAEVTESRYPFLPGEKLRYGIYSTVLKVGQATISYRGREKLGDRMVDVVVVEAKAPGFQDVDTIYGLIENFTPIRVERKIRLFGEDITIVEEYNTTTNEVIITRRGKTTTIKEFKSNDTIGNVILLLYYFRLNKRKFNIGDKLDFNLPTKKLEMLVDKFTTLRVPKGKFNALFIRSNPPKFKVWLDPEKGNIPLRIQGAVGFGNTYLALIDIENSS